MMYPSKEWVHHDGQTDVDCCVLPLVTAYISSAGGFTLEEMQEKFCSRGCIWHKRVNYNRPIEILGIKSDKFPEKDVMLGLQYLFWVCEFHLFYPNTFDGVENSETDHSRIILIFVGAFYYNSTVFYVCYKLVLYRWNITNFFAEV